MSLQFEYPWLLALLWLAPAAGVVWHLLTTRRSLTRQLVSPRMAAHLAPAPSPTRRLWQLVLLVTGLVFGLIAAARPQWGLREETVYQRGRDLLILLDVSRSMLATDVHPSRLGRAKVDLFDLIKQLRGDRVGLLAFRGRPVQLCPLTTDYGFLAEVLDGADVDSAPSGETNIGDAILEAIKTFEGDEGAHKAIVLVSDGDDLAGRSEEAITQARENGIPLFTVGFGSSEGANVPAPGSKKESLQYQGQLVVSKLNNELMLELAEKTGGAYVPVGLANVKLGDLYRDHLSRIAARDQEESVQRHYVERYQLFLLVAVLAFLAAAFLSRGQIALRARRDPDAHEPPSARTPGAPLEPDTRPALKDLSVPPSTLKQLVLLVLLGSCLTGSSLARTNSPAAPVTGSVTGRVSATAVSTNTPPGREGARLAQRLYLLGQYPEAAAAYRQAARSAAQSARDTYLFNAGCALLKAGDYEEAADCFRSLGGNQGAQGAAASYNLGCTLYQQAGQPGTEDDARNAGTDSDPAALDARVQSLKKSAAAFQKTLRLQPDNGDGRKNLGVVAGQMDQAVEQAKVARLMAQYGQTPPGALADLMLLQQRKLIQDIANAFTNTTPKMIDQLEGLAGEEDQTADLMIPLKGKLLQAMAQAQSSGAISNAQQQIAQLNGFAESIRDRMHGVALSLRDLDRKAYPEASEAEAAVYTLWKGVASYEQLLREDMLRQTNALALTEPNRAQNNPAVGKAALTHQQEARDLTGLFSERFEQSVPPEGLSRPAPPPAVTNQAETSSNTVEQLITPETRQKILQLAGEANLCQQTAADLIVTNAATSLTSQRKAYGLLEEILKLLPKNPAQQPQQQEQQQEQQKQDQPQEQPQPQPREQQQEQQPKPQEQKRGEMSPEDVKRMLDRAMQREKEHEQEKRERNAAIPMVPGERDW
jgi:Ca-activated chloride channel family protein